MEKIPFINGNSPYLNARNLNQLQDNVETAIAIGGVSGDTLPVGAMLPFGSTNLPANWLECNGQAVSRTEYALLFAVIGTDYGAGDGSTTFNLPDKRGRVSVGRNTGDTDFDTLGETGGEKTHTLIVNEMPSHTHDINSGATTMTSGGSNDVEQTSGSRTYTFLNVQSTGGGQPHNNLQPYMVDCWIIKAKQSAGVVANVVDNLNSTSATDALSANQGRILKTVTKTVDSNGWTKLAYPNGIIEYVKKGNKNINVAGNEWYNTEISNLPSDLSQIGNNILTSSAKTPDAAIAVSVGTHENSSSEILATLQNRYSGSVSTTLFFNLRILKIE